MLFNIFAMIMCWCSMSSSFNVLSFFMKYLPGDIYMNSGVSGLSCFIFLFSHILFKHFSSKKTLVISFMITLFAALILIILSCLSCINPFNFSLILLISRCGISLATCFIFVIHTELFSTGFLATSYGICNFFARGVTLFAPLVAESDN